MTTPTIVRAVLFALTIAALGFVPGVGDAASLPDELSELLAGGGDCHSQFPLGLFPLQSGSISVANPRSATGLGALAPAGKLRTFDFSAIQNNTGSVTGHAKFNFVTIGLVLGMDINCLNFVTPKMVRISGPITTSNVSVLVGLTATFEALGNHKSRKKTKDNGEDTDDDGEDTDDKGEVRP
jgi:hypothetical protein